MREIMPSVLWCGEYIEHKVNDGHAGQAHATCSTENVDCDQIFTGYFVAKRPGIKGIKKTNSQGFPCENSSARLRVEQAALNTISRESMGATSGSSRGDLLSEFLRTNYGGGDIRSLRDCEADTIPDAESVSTRFTRSPSGQKYYAYFIDGWAYRLIESASISMNGRVLSTVYSKLLYILHEISYSAAQRLALRELTSRPPPGLSASNETSMLVEMSARADEAWVPMSFFNTADSASALNTMNCALGVSAPRLNISLAGITSLIKRSSPKTRVVLANDENNDIRDENVTLSVVFHHIWLDPRYSSSLQQNNFSQLITGFDTRSQSEKFDAVDINFSSPTTMLWWVVSRASAEQDNAPFYWWGLFGEEPVVKASITLSGRHAQHPLSGKFFRLAQPLEKCESPPESCVYMYGFCFNQTDKSRITGSVHLRQYTSAQLCLQLQEHLTRHDRVTIHVFREYYAILEYLSTGDIIVKK